MVLYFLYTNGDEMEGLDYMLIEQPGRTCNIDGYGEPPHIRSQCRLSSYRGRCFVCVRLDVQIGADPASPCDEYVVEDPIEACLLRVSPAVAAALEHDNHALCRAIKVRPSF